MGFSINNLKKLVFNKLKNDATLITLLGESENIFHFHPKQENKIAYPIIVYHILGIEDNIYNADRNANINSLIINIDIFSSNSTMEEIDNIADRIYTLFHGTNLSNDNILVYNCSRDYQDESYDEDSRCWRINARYIIANSAK